MLIDADERPGIAELYGRAANASNLKLESRSPGGETALLRVAAMGAAVLHVQHGADRRREAVAMVLADRTHNLEGEDVIAGELAQSLWHIRYAGQHEEVPLAIALYAAWLPYRSRFSALADGLVILPKFSERVLHEWLSDRCEKCKGCGIEERSKTGQWVAPARLGYLPRNVARRACSLCQGSRRPIPSPVARRKALGITMERYDSEHWHAKFAAAVPWLTKLIARRLNRPLTVQLERSKKRV